MKRRRLVVRLLGWFLVTVLLVIVAICVLSPLFNAPLWMVVQATVGVDELQKWAIQLIETHPPGAVYEEFIPRNIAAIASLVIVLEARDSRPKHVIIVILMGHMHSGIRIGPPGFVPYQDSSFSFHKWKDGVWPCFGP